MTLFHDKLQDLSSQEHAWAEVQVLLGDEVLPLGLGATVAAQEGYESPYKMTQSFTAPNF